MQSFNKLNIKKILGYMDFLKNNSPRRRFRQPLQKSRMSHQVLFRRVLALIYLRLLVLIFFLLLSFSFLQIHYHPVFP